MENLTKEEYEDMIEYYIQVIKDLEVIYYNMKQDLINLEVIE